MAGAPGLPAFGRKLEAGGQAVQFLEDVGRFDAPLDPAADAPPELRLDVPADDEDDLVESGPQRVVDGIIEEDLAVRPDGVDLLEPAVPGTQAGGHDDECSEAMALS